MNFLQKTIKKDNAEGFEDSEFETIERPNADAAIEKIQADEKQRQKEREIARQKERERARARERQHERERRASRPASRGCWC